MPRYRHEVYDSPHTGSIASLLGRQSSIRANAARDAGNANARAAEIRGQSTANTIGSIGQAATQAIGTIGQLAQDRRNAPMLAQERDLAMRERMAKVAEIDEKLRASRANQEEADAAKAAVQTAMQDAGGDLGKAADFLLKGGWVNLAKEVRGQQPKPAEGYTMNPGDVRFGPDNQQVASVPAKPPEPKMFPITVPGPNGEPIRKMVPESELMSGVREYRAPASDGAPERPSVWVAKGGESRYVTPSQAAELSTQGWKAGNSREQGRPVTSGDSGRIADFRTSLDDLFVLNTALSANGATGWQAKLGASVPKWATDITGWGADAKSRQAIIDRVKQVIGKTLEGGVLRKEDEIKYEKILPTIDDPASVAADKLKGLDDAIELRSSRFIDALEDSGYDVTAHRSRGTAAAPGAPKEGDTKEIPGYPGTEQTFRNGEWIRTK